MPDTLPDGRPVSAAIAFADDQVTLTGTVPTEEAATRLAAFAADYRLTPVPVVNSVPTVDPSTPASGGVRIVEFNSINFVGDEVVIILEEHAQQIDRVVVAMQTYPEATLQRDRQHRSAGR